MYNKVSSYITHPFSSVYRSVNAAVKCLVKCCLVVSRLDYCNCILAGLPASSLAQLQRGQNAAARLVLGLWAHDHVTAALRELHWLPVKYRTQYKLCLLMHSVSTQRCSAYLSQLVQPVANSTCRHGLRSTNSQSQELERNWMNVLFLLLVPQRGMHFQPTYAATVTLLHLNFNLRLICLPQHLMCNPYMFLVHVAVLSSLFLLNM